MRFEVAQIKWRAICLPMVEQAAFDHAARAAVQIVPEECFVCERIALGVPPIVWCETTHGACIARR